MLNHEQPPTVSRVFAPALSLRVSLPLLLLLLLAPRSAFDREPKGPPGFNHTSRGPPIRPYAAFETGLTENRALKSANGTWAASQRGSSTILSMDLAVLFQIRYILSPRAIKDSNPVPTPVWANSKYPGSCGPFSRPARKGPASLRNCFRKSDARVPAYSRTRNLPLMMETTAHSSKTMDL